jgi:hypothetical protein
LIVALSECDDVDMPNVADTVSMSLMIRRTIPDYPLLWLRDVAG